MGTGGLVVPWGLYRMVAAEMREGGGWGRVVAAGAGRGVVVEGVVAVRGAVLALRVGEDLALWAGGDVVMAGGAWNAAVGAGLRVLGGEWVAGGLLRVLPGGGDAAVGEMVTVSAAVAGYAAGAGGPWEPWAGWPVVFVVGGAAAMRVDGLVGVAPGVVVFPAGTRLQVTGAEFGAGGQRRVYLGIPAALGEQGAAERAGPVVARWRTGVQDLPAGLLRAGEGLAGAAAGSLAGQLAAAGVTADDGGGLRPWAEGVLAGELGWLAGLEPLISSGRAAELLGVSRAVVFGWLGLAEVPLAAVPQGAGPAWRSWRSGWRRRSGSCAAGRRAWTARTGWRVTSLMRGPRRRYRRRRGMRRGWRRGSAGWRGCMPGCRLRRAWTARAREGRGARRRQAAGRVTGRGRRCGRCRS